jgi:hypothetical protein
MQRGGASETASDTSLGQRWLRTDWQTYLHTGGVLDDKARIWETFFREKEHILLRGDEEVLQKRCQSKFFETIH